MIHHKPSRIFIHRGRPHIELAFSIQGKRRSHPVKILLSPEEAAAHDHDAFLSRWEAHYSEVEAADEGYRALTGTTISVCHRNLMITDCKLQTSSPMQVNLAIAYTGEWNGLKHRGYKGWDATAVVLLPPADKVLDKLKSAILAECELTHHFKRLSDAIKQKS